MKPAEDGVCAEGSLRRDTDTELGRGIRDELWRHRGGDSGERTEASSLGEWREIARLETGDQWSLETPPAAGTGGHDPPVMVTLYTISH